MKLVIHSSVVVVHPVPTEEMVERRNQILEMWYGMKSLNYLLEDNKLKECGLLGEKESTDDGYYKKYAKWDEVPIPSNYVSPSIGPLKFQSPVMTVKRSRAE